MKSTETESAERSSASPDANETTAVVVDNALNILEFVGHTGPYLQLPPGKVSFNLRAMIRPGLQQSIFSAIDEVREGHGPIQRLGVRFRVPEGAKKGNVDVKRIKDTPFECPIFQISFEDVISLPLEQGAAQEDKGSRHPAAKAAIAKTAGKPRPYAEIGVLQQQLLNTKENLNAIVQDREIALRKLIESKYALETTATELEAANAELEDYNDELGTTNEELQAALAQRDAAEAETVRKELKIQVQHAEKLKSLGVLAGGIAHDFNNLLAAVIGFADLALEDLPADAPARRHIEEVVTAGERAAELTSQMLAYSGKVRFEARVLDLHEVVAKLDSLMRAAVSKKAVLRYDLAEDLPAVEADASQIQQVLLNLITNASDAIGKGDGVINVKTAVMAADRDYLDQTCLLSQRGSDEELPEGDYVYLEVRDTGCGMDGETIGKIFDPFFTTKFSGRGLGLSAVLGIVRGHGGAIRVWSEPRSGTTFRVLFPCSKKAAKQSKRPPTMFSALRGHGTILVVDDEEDVRKMATKTLERHGFSVVTATDGRDAVEVFQSSGDMIDAVLLDVTMPHMDGEETSIELRRIRPDVKIILSSGYHEQHAIQQFDGQTGTVFLQKPYRSKKLVEVVHAVLGQRLEKNLRRN
jgi:signal transduction histidine kinase